MHRTSTEKMKNHGSVVREEYYLLAIVPAIIALQWLWPNVIHEPLHWIALKLQGASGTITYDWGILPAPHITTDATFGMPGALLFLLLPSLVSVALCLVLWLTPIPKHALHANLTHTALPAYLGFDLIINIKNYALPTSDFRMLLATPGWLPIVLMLMVTCATAILIMRTQFVLQARQAR